MCCNCSHQLIKVISLGPGTPDPSWGLYIPSWPIKLVLSNHVHSASASARFQFLAWPLWTRTVTFLIFFFFLPLFSVNIFAGGCSLAWQVNKLGPLFPLSCLYFACHVSCNPTLHCMVSSQVNTEPTHQMPDSYSRFYTDTLIHAELQSVSFIHSSGNLHKCQPIFRQIDILI